MIEAVHKFSKIDFITTKSAPEYKCLLNREQTNEQTTNGKRKKRQLFEKYMANWMNVVYLPTFGWSFFFIIMI